MVSNYYKSNNFYFISILHLFFLVDCDYFILLVRLNFSTINYKKVVTCILFIIFILIPKWDLVTDLTQEPVLPETIAPLTLHLRTITSDCSV